LEPGAVFDFHITLFGEAARYLPYFVLAVPETGRTGLGPGRGRFALKTIYKTLDEHFEGRAPFYPFGHGLPSRPSARTNTLAWPARAGGKSTDFIRFFRRRPTE